MEDLRIENLAGVPSGSGEKVKQKGSGDFASAISGAVKRVSGLEKEADKSILDLLQGKAEIHETMIALQKADLSMRLLLTIRNKVVEAYREIMRMPF